MQAQRRVDIASAEISFDGRVDYYSMLNPSAFRLFDHSQIAGLALIADGICCAFAGTNTARSWVFCLHCWA